MKIDNVWINLKWIIKSEKEISNNYEIYLAYRDVSSWKFQLISRSKDLTFTWNDQMWFYLYEYEILWKDIKIHWNWTELVISFNWKYREIDLSKNEVIWNTVFLEKNILDLNIENNWDLQKENFIWNSIEKANNILFDPFVQSYINEERFLKDPIVSWLKEWEYEQYIGKYWREEALSILNNRSNEIQKLIDNWTSKQKIMNYVFDKSWVQSNLEDQWYSKEDIEYIKNNWFNQSFKIIEKYTVPDHIIKIQEDINLYKNIDVNEIVNWTYKLKKEQEELDKILNENKEKKETIITIQKKEKEEELSNWNEYWIYFAIWFIIFFIIFLSFFLIKKKKKNIS